MRGEGRPSGAPADRAGGFLRVEHENAQKVLGIREVTLYPLGTGLVTALTFSRCELTGR